MRVLSEDNIIKDKISKKMNKIYEWAKRYVHVHVERERERERGEGKTACMCIYMYS